MPIYEYRCDDCQDTFEVLTSYANRDHAQTCPACNGGHSVVQISGFASLGGMPAAGDFSAPAAQAGGCACGGACSCGGH